MGRVRFTRDSATDSQTSLRRGGATKYRPNRDALEVFVFLNEAFLRTEYFGLEAPIEIGRSQDADICLDSQLVSRHHAVIFTQDGQLVVQDGDSTNGTWVNENPVEGPTTLSERSVVAVGPFLLHTRLLKAQPSRTNRTEAFSTLRTRRVPGANHRKRLTASSDEADSKQAIDHANDDASIGIAAYEAVEVIAYQKGTMVNLSVLRTPQQTYVVGQPTPQGTLAPGVSHCGLKLVRIHGDGHVDLVFPWDARGYVLRDGLEIPLRELGAGCAYASLPLDPTDEASVVLGHGPDAVRYLVRFRKSRPLSPSPHREA
jgi:hypothetical protein